MIVNEIIDSILSLGAQFVGFSQQKTLLTYPIIKIEKGDLIIQPFSDGIVFSYYDDDEPLGILLTSGRVWSFQDYAIVPPGDLFDERGWGSIRRALEEALQDADD
jgi:hypothetical protein